MLRAEWNRCEDSSPESLRHRDDVMRLRPQWHIAPSRPVPVLSSRRMPETKPRAAVARFLLPLAVPEIHVLLCQNRGGGKSRTSNATTLVSLRGWQVLDGDDEAPPIFPTHMGCVGKIGGASSSPSNTCQPRRDTRVVALLVLDLPPPRFWQSSTWISGTAKGRRNLATAARGFVSGILRLDSTGTGREGAICHCGRNRITSSRCLRDSGELSSHRFHSARSIVG